MFEMLISPRVAEQKPYRLFFVGFLYSSLSLLLVNLIFVNDPVLGKHASVFILMFTVIFSMPFIHSLVRMQEIRDVTSGRGRFKFKEHARVIYALMFMFLGFLVAFSLLYVLLPDDLTVKNFYTQIEQFCRINIPRGIEACFREYGIAVSNIKNITGNAVGFGFSDVIAIFMNNLYVLMFTLLFSLAFGAGAIFILAWNASVIAAAIGMLVKASFADFYTSLFMYLTHGIPEIAAYFVIALAGGILSTAVIRRDFRDGKFHDIIMDFLMLAAISVAVLFLAALIEVYVTPAIFG